MKLIIGCDHAAFTEKENLKKWLIENGHEVDDQGCNSAERCDYPDFAKAVVKQVLKQNALGILLCGSGVGVSMVANRFAGIRAALCGTARIAELSRQHNNANVLCLGARLHEPEQLKEIAKAWLEASFEGGRHEDRVNMFNQLGEQC